MPPQPNVYLNKNEYMAIQMALGHLKETLQENKFDWNPQTRKQFAEIIASANSAAKKIEKVTGVSSQLPEYEPGEEKEYLNTPGSSVVGDYSPKLKKAMEEIKGILGSYDIGAIVILHSPGACEFLNYLVPSYSCMQWRGDELRIVARLQEDFKGDKAARDFKLMATANMMHMLGKVAGEEALMLLEASKKIDEVLDADHGEGSVSSHTSQNN